GDAGAFGHGLELGPHDLGVDLGVVRRLGRKAAIGARYDVLAADDAGEAGQALGYQLGVLHDVATVRNRAWQEELFGRELDPLPDVVLVLVTRVRRLERVRASVHL